MAAKGGWTKKTSCAYQRNQVGQKYSRRMYWMHCGRRLTNTVINFRQLARTLSWNGVPNKVQTFCTRITFFTTNTDWSYCVVAGSESCRLQALESMH
ncbi:hypothetical protein BaRGS_00013409 [Batillaria attramentaria]|uniref:Uncharacterized protein n=1 Tax=Batillaria attramentaria TaxID=370345 RepID=A0ABD0L6Y4_9CAEN